MKLHIVKTATLAAPILLLSLVAACPAQAQDAKALYPTMAAIDRYLMADRDAEIALARSAAPATISGDATVLILEKDGYKTAVEGKNGFTCLVERSWMSPVGSQEFWNPKMRGPVCYNPQASRSILPYTIQRTRLVLTGLTKTQMAEGIKAALEKNQLPLPEPGAMSYMLSKGGYLGDSVGHWHPHLMFHIANAGGASWGANLPDSPVMLNDEFPQGPEPETVFLVPVGHWSDGTAVTADASETHQH
jgi:hypothetical protein